MHHLFLEPAFALHRCIECFCSHGIVRVSKQEVLEKLFGQLFSFKLERMQRALANGSRIDFWQFH